MRPTSPLSAFLAAECGAVAVDWAVLTAAVTGLALAASGRMEGYQINLTAYLAAELGAGEDCAISCMRPLSPDHELSEP